MIKLDAYSKAADFDNLDRFLSVFSARECDQYHLVFQQEWCPFTVVDWCRRQTAKQDRTEASCVQLWCGQVCGGSPLVEWSAGVEALAVADSPPWPDWGCANSCSGRKAWPQCGLCWTSGVTECSGRSCPEETSCVLKPVVLETLEVLISFSCCVE